MARADDLQPELFREFQQAAARPWWARRWRLPQRYLILRVAHEDLILAAIGGLMILVLGFCAGVERGKWMTVVRAPSGLPVSPVPAAEPVVRSPVEPPPSPVRPPVVQPAPRPSTGTKVAGYPSGGGVPVQWTGRAPGPSARYVVQVASFVDRHAAAVAHTRLTQRGLRAAVVPQGRYYVLYAEGFSTHAQATEAAARLRKAYRDCFVRKLTSDRRG